MTEIPDDVMKAAEKVMEEIIVFSDAAQAKAYIARAILNDREKRDIKIAISGNPAPTGSFARYNEFLIICHPDMPPHVWDGKKMIKVEIGVDLAEGT